MATTEAGQNQKEKEIADVKMNEENKESKVDKKGENKESNVPIEQSKFKAF